MANSNDTSGTSDASTGEALRILVLLRHAKASHSLGPDISRELTQRGRAQAEDVGRWLVGQGVRIDGALVSPSRRTRETFDHLVKAGVSGSRVTTEESLYGGDPQDIIEAVNGVEESVRTLLVVGHAPGLPSLAHALEDHTDPADRRLEHARSWPTATVAIVAHHGSWEAFPGRSAVVALHAP